MKEILEDTWHDILLKAVRGWNQDPSRLALENHIEEKEVRSLIDGNLKESTLVAIAPSLQLHPEALLAITHDKYHPKTVELPNNFKRFTTTYHGMEVHSYLLWSPETLLAVAFDTGAEITPLLQELSERRLKLSSIFLTHSHSDHVVQLKELIHLTGAIAWIDEQEALVETQLLPLNYCYQLDSHITIKAYSTPGHSLGGTTFFIQEPPLGIAVVGDALFAGSVGGIPTKNYLNALEVIQEKILSLPDETILAPGHGPLTTVDQEKKNNPFFLND